MREPDLNRARHMSFTGTVDNNSNVSFSNSAAAAQLAKAARCFFAGFFRCRAQDLFSFNNLVNVFYNTECSNIVTPGCPGFFFTFNRSHTDIGIRVRYFLLMTITRMSGGFF